MAYDKLVLHPLNPWAILHDPPLLVEALRSTGLIGDRFGWAGEIHYAPGPRFRKLVLFTFAEPQERELHVSLSETAEQPGFLGTTHAYSPRCRACREPLTDWRAQLAAWRREGLRRPWTCPKCRRAAEVSHLDWAHSGGIARYSLDLWGIRRNAAAPSAELLGILERVTYEKWNYFYDWLSASLTPPGQMRVRPGLGYSK